MEEENKIIEVKARGFCNLGISVHVLLKNGGWANGYIREVGADFFLIDEFKEGEKLIFFLEVKEINQYREKK